MRNIILGLSCATLTIINLAKVVASESVDFQPFTAYDTTTAPSYLQFSADTLTISSLKTADDGGFGRVASLDVVESGKHYWEVEVECGPDSKGFQVGVAAPGWLGESGDPNFDSIWVLLSDGLRKMHGLNREPLGDAQTLQGDILRIALDMDSNLIYFALNGAWLGEADPAIGKNHAYMDVSDRVSAFYASGNRECAPLTTRTNFGQSEFRNSVPTGFYKGYCSQGNCAVSAINFDIDKSTSLAALTVMSKKMFR